jgi:hypothetical protein
MRLQLYDFEMKYKPGNQNILADFLSRSQNNENQVETEEDYLDQLVANIETIDETSTLKYQIATNELYTQMELFENIKPIQSNREREYAARETIENNPMENTPNNNHLNIEVIASEPNSTISEINKSYADEQQRDEDIQWIKNLILNYKGDKPLIKEFNNNIQRGLYKEYNNLRVVEKIVYRVTEDTNGYNRTQFVLP